MKKIFALLLVLVLILSSCALGDPQMPDDDQGSENKDNVPESSQPANEDNVPESSQPANKDNVPESSQPENKDNATETPPNDGDGSSGSDDLKEDGLRQLTIYKIDSLADLERLKNDIEADSWYMDALSFVSYIAQNYDEEFYEKNTLFVVHIGWGSSTHKFGVKDVAINDNNLCVYVEPTNNPWVVTDDFVFKYVTVTVSDSEIEGCIEFDARMCPYKGDN